jgi:hypothetical protein
LRVRSIKAECQRAIADGKYRTLPTLPANLVLTEEQRAVIERYISDLEALCKQTPAESEMWERATLVNIAELLMSPSRSARLGEIEAEIAGKHYLIALKDVPTWAVEVAIENWLRGCCGNNQRGEPYDCEWRPAPAALRQIAVSVKRSLADQIQTLRRLLNAEPLIEFGEEHRARMRAKVAGLITVKRA